MFCEEMKRPFAFRTLTMVVDVVRPRHAVSTNTTLEVDVETAFSYGLSFDGFAVIMLAEDAMSTKDALGMEGLVLMVRVVARPTCRRLVFGCGCDVRGHLALRIAVAPLSPSMFVCSALGQSVVGSLEGMIIG
jgi:hypothetical protein